VPEQRIRRDLDAALVRNRKVGAQLLALSARSACRVAIKYSVALRIASAASRLLGFVAGREAAAGVFSLFSCPVFRQPAVVSDPWEFWIRLVESSSRRSATFSRSRLDGLAPAAVSRGASGVGDQ
jgi:hypothetical protein